jgi:branched-chain amino acid transport system permease protein
MRTGIRNVYTRSYKPFLLFAVVLALIPFIASSNYVLSTLIIIGLYALVCTGLSMLMGYAGQISLGHAAFYGIGAYSSAYATVNMGLTPLLGIVLGIVIAALIAFIVGIPTLRLTGHYLALATLGFGMIMFVVFKQAKPLTGGLEGFIGIPPMNLFGYQIDTEVKYFYFVWALVLLGVLLMRNVIQSRVGRALRSLESSEIAANSLGVDINAAKLQIFVLSAVFASVAGGVYAHYVSFLNPTLFTADTSILFLIMSVLGGGASIWGSIVGTAVYIALTEILKDVVPSIIGHGSDEFQTIFFGVLLVILLIYMPEGLAGAFGKWSRKLFKRRRTGIAGNGVNGEDHASRIPGGQP